jgi:antagonist of KipI
MSEIKILKPGFFTTIQDLGRFGFQQYGMPVSGAMDLYSFKRANFLVGNDQNEACLEATAIGPTIEFESETAIAICGADMNPEINGSEIEMYKTVHVNSGDKLSFKGLKSGFRTYISFGGGIDVPLVMGSKSTYLRGRIGGIEGRQLKSGDRLKLGEYSSKTKMTQIEKRLIPIYKDCFTARIIPGPEADYFTVKGLVKFLNSEFTLTEQCDRMGYRLSGKKIQHKSSSEIISSGIEFGTIQVPAHGNPIIMMADRQTTGGYPRIANVISVDLPYLAQLQAGDKIRFQEITIEESHNLLKLEIEHFNSYS